MSSHNSAKQPLALPPPSTDSGSESHTTTNDSDAPLLHLDVNSESSNLKLDALGPLVVNSDGTLSRIANWPNMTEGERARTLRVLTVHNKIRIANQEAKQDTAPKEEASV